MAYAAQLGKFYYRYVILLLLCLLLLVGPRINWKIQGTARTRKTISVVSGLTIKVNKAWQSPNIIQGGI